MHVGGPILHTPRNYLHLDPFLSLVLGSSALRPVYLLIGPSDLRNQATQIILVERTFMLTKVTSDQDSDLQGKSI